MVACGAWQQAEHSNPIHARGLLRIGGQGYGEEDKGQGYDAEEGEPLRVEGLVRTDVSLAFELSSACPRAPNAAAERPAAASLQPSRRVLRRAARAAG